MFKHIEDFLQELGNLKNELFPEAVIEVVYKRIDKASIRVELSHALLIDIYVNIKTARYDFSLIKDNKRIFGYDNLGGWHCHPLNNPGEHIRCNEPSTVRQILKEMLTIINGL